MICPSPTARLGCSVRRTHDAIVFLGVAGTGCAGPRCESLRATRAGLHRLTVYLCQYPTFQENDRIMSDKGGSDLDVFDDLLSKKSSSAGLGPAPSAFGAAPPPPPPPSLPPAPPVSKAAPPPIRQKTLLGLPPPPLPKDGVIATPPSTPMAAPTARRFADALGSAGWQQLGCSAFISRWKLPSGTNFWGCASTTSTGPFYWRATSAIRCGVFAGRATHPTRTIIWCRSSASGRHPPAPFLHPHRWVVLRTLCRLPYRHRQPCLACPYPLCRASCRHLRRWA